MGVVAMLVMCTIRFEHIFVPSAPGGSKWDLITIGPVAFEEMFGIVIIVALLFYVHGKHLRSCPDSQLT